MRDVYGQIGADYDNGGDVIGQTGYQETSFFPRYGICDEYSNRTRVSPNNPHRTFHAEWSKTTAVKERPGYCQATVDADCTEIPD